jgi:hypothetical protein
MNPSEQDVALLAHVIQLSVAPVFLLTGIGAILGVMANRLARIIDRARIVEGNWGGMEIEERKDARAELASLAHRAALASWAINFCALAALLVCVLIAALFIDAFVGLSLRWLVGALFVATMFALIAGILSFLREVYVATHTVKIGPPRERPAARA